jgi:hypothetical protein
MKEPAKKWPTSSGYPSSLRQPLPMPKQSETLFGRRGVTSPTGHEIHRLLFGSAGVLTCATLVIILLEIAPKLPARYTQPILDFLSSPVAQNVKLSVIVVALGVAGYITLFRVFRLFRKKED